MSTYVTEAAITLRLGSRDALLDWDEDAAEDDGLIEELIAEAGALIDARLAQRLEVPFADVTDTPATPDVIQLIAKHLVLWLIYSHHDPESRDATHHWTVAESHLTGIMEGKYDVPSATRQTASKAGIVVSYEAEDRAFAGEDDYGVSRLRGI
jgi:phage gp36-like protein